MHGATSTGDPQNHPEGFVAPSVTALALSVAMKAATEANERLAEVVFNNVITPIGNGKSVQYKNIDPLFDYSEYGMVTVIFSFQALETFCNQMIANQLKGAFSLLRSGVLAFTIPANISDSTRFRFDSFVRICGETRASITSGFSARRRESSVDRLLGLEVRRACSLLRCVSRLPDRESDPCLRV